MRIERLTAVSLTTIGLLLASCAPAPPAAPVAAPSPRSAPTTAPAAAPSPKPAPPVATPKPATDQPRYGGTLALPAGGDPATLDPHRISSVSFFGPVGPMYNGLVQYDDSGKKVVPDLAERWEASSDGKVYTFHLRKGVKWHDGTPFSSADAMLSLKRIMEYASLGSVLQIDKVEAPDKNTLRVDLNYPQASFLAMLAHGRDVIGPKHVFDAKGDLKQNVVGTGPFKLKEYAAGVSFRFEKNKEYFVAGRPYLDAVAFYIIRDMATRFAGFRTGRLQIYGHLPVSGELLPTQVDIIKREMPQAIVRPFEQVAGFGMVPNWNSAPWRDPRVRRAAFLAIDREKFLETVAESTGHIGVSVFYAEWSLPKEELMKTPGFRKPKDADIAEAKRLLAEAGSGTGLKSSLLVRGDVPAVVKAGEFVKEQLSKIGMDLTLQVSDYAVITDMWQRGTYEAMIQNPQVGLTDPDITGRYIHTKLGKHFAGGGDEKVLELYYKQSQVATEKERKEIAFELQRRIAEVVPHVFLGWRGTFIAFAPEVKGYPEGGPLHAHTKLQDVWLSK